LLQLFFALYRLDVFMILIKINDGIIASFCD
jgi:hypothetical protein